MFPQTCHLLLLVYIISSSAPSTNGYQTPSVPQYHIQTDEGPQRYFRYQTLNGQYRKEKRLEDGTVVGSYAWIDDGGYLRQRDYIADSAGYRILQTKNLYVGRDMPINEAIKTAKSVSPSAGTLVSARQRIPAYRGTSPFRGTSPSAAYIPSSITSTTVAPVVVTSTERPYVEITNNAVPSSTPTPFVTSTREPFVEITPSPIPSTASYVSTTEAPIDNGYYSTPAPITGYSPADNGRYIPSRYESLPPERTYNDREQNSVEYNPYVSPAQDSYVFHNGPTYPIDKRGHTYRGSNRRAGYDPQYADYDGVSVTNDGFRYYIPRAYHEEETLPGDKRSGSFGYIDPFGIRRVVYYNAEPGKGFQHKKNNRYVGFDATPYDPRPY